jgi:hypothetical protein
MRPYKREKRLVRCPKCHEIGHLQWKAVGSYYRPKDRAYFLNPRLKV